MTGTVYRLIIPNWAPARLNTFLGRHWSVGYRLKSADREMVGWYAKVAEIPTAPGRRKISMRITLGPRQRACDPDSQWKSLLDALVAAQLLVDDSSTWCEMGSVEFNRGPERQTEIVLEEV